MATTSSQMGVQCMGVVKATISVSELKSAEDIKV